MDAERFRKICGLLGSSHAGERAAAALKATAMLKAAGHTWASVGVNGALYREVYMGAGSRAEVLAYQAQADLYRKLLEDERERNTRLLREINRLKGQWPKGDVPETPKRTTPPDDPSDKDLRRKIADCLEAAARGEIVLKLKDLKLFDRVMRTQWWTDKDRLAVEHALRWAWKRAA